MTGTQEIAEKYQRLITQEDATRSELAAAEARLQTVDQEDIAAGAEAALAGKPLPARKAIKLKHAVENLRIDLQRLDEAVFLVQQEARRAVGERYSSFPIFVPSNVPADRAEVIASAMVSKNRQPNEADDEFEARVIREIPRSERDAETIIREAHRQRELSLDRRLPRLTERPADLIAWITAAYDAEDVHAQDGYERKAKKQREHEATEAVNRAKAEHRRRGLPNGSFSMHAYPDIVLPEHLAEFAQAITRSPFQKVRDQLPSLEEAQNEPVAEPQPVNDEETPAEFRQREIERRPPAAPDAKPVAA